MEVKHLSKVSMLDITESSMLLGRSRLSNCMTDLPLAFGLKWKGFGKCGDCCELLVVGVSVFLIWLESRAFGSNVIPNTFWVA